MFQYGLSDIVLLICTYTDLRYRKVYQCVIVIHLLLALLLHLSEKDLVSAAVLFGIVPGLCCLLLSVATQQAMGRGDAFLVLSCGFSVGISNCLLILSAAFLCAGIWALVLICFRQGKRGTEIPFVPFLLLGAVLQGLEAWIK